MNTDYGVLDKLELTVLVEDYAGYDSGLLAQHGVSFYLEVSNEAGRKTILFDTGQSAETVLNNMKLLGKDPDGIDYVILSHCHYDHTGGLIGILEECPKKPLPVLAHPDLFRPNFSLEPALRSVGMKPGDSRDAVEKAGGELFLTAEPFPLMAGVLTTGEIKEKVDFESALTYDSRTIENGQIVYDSMIDDVSLILILRQGLVVVSGCSHAGIISIINAAVRLTGINRVHAVIGGFHLIEADKERIVQTTNALSDLETAQIYTGHCTGFAAEAQMFGQLGERFHKLRTGLKIYL